MTESGPKLLLRAQRAEARHAQLVRQRCGVHLKQVWAIFAFARQSASCATREVHWAIDERRAYRGNLCSM